MTLRIEHHPENGHAPWVVIARGSVWFAYSTEGDAKNKLGDPDLIAFDLFPLRSGAPLRRALKPALLKLGDW